MGERKRAKGWVVAGNVQEGDNGYSGYDRGSRGKGGRGECVVRNRTENRVKRPHKKNLCLGLNQATPQKQFGFFNLVNSDSI